MISENVSLKSLNTFGIEVSTKRFAKFSTIEELSSILANRNNDALLVLGGGSNILFTKDFNGLVIKNEIKGFEILYENEDEVYVKVGGGVVWHSFVLECIDKNFGGVENLSLIPGSVGASPMQNIGAYGTEIKDVFVDLEAYNIESGEIQTFDKDQCQFGYRESIFKKEFKDQYIIISVTYRLTKSHRINSSYGAIKAELEQKGISRPKIRDVSNAVIAIRSSRLPDPSEIGNAGSFFKNPIVNESKITQLKEQFESFPHYPAPNGKTKLAAGWLIEQAGWKGKTFETYGVHKNQALVLVNYGGCKGGDILDLSTQIIADVEAKFGVVLEREVNII
ncbi:MAG: UDP-N-acetylmuramate dehydrogenase [Crocinitomicaceae bacterium]|nr:UDP-N-acetylmuramate dehydrogenase [Crocinitomicaceae bacterium]